ncbi:MAG: hypothetical protein LOD90_10540 [Symbiobacteriaceae bacterium]
MVALVLGSAYAIAHDFEVTARDKHYAQAEAVDRLRKKLRKPRLAFFQDSGLLPGYGLLVTRRDAGMSVEGAVRIDVEPVEVNAK